MSELLDYIQATLETEYENEGLLHKTSVNELMLYRHKDTDKRLVFIRSALRNDEVFRRLKGIDTGGLTPTIYEVCSEEDCLYVLEEYVAGRPLSDYLSDGEALPERDVIAYLKDLCGALEILHALGIVHRDIKPENIIIRDEKACLIDFSVAKIINNHAGDTMNLGTAGYAAPEQYGISQSLPTTDIYALGVLANILATGTHPTAQIAKGKLGKIIKKCTNIQISKRFQSTEELEKALRKI